VRGIPLTWFRDYLTDRYRQVKCNGIRSTFRRMDFGVPQGSVLGPLLFLMYINDLPKATTLLNFILFADDSNVFFSHASYRDLFKIVNNKLVQIANWFKADKLSLNLNKTNYVLFTAPGKVTPQPQEKLIIDQTEIPQVTVTKFLGVYLDQNLNWNEHIEHISHNIAKNIGAIKEISYLILPDI